MCQTQICLHFESDSYGCTGMRASCTHALQGLPWRWELALQGMLSSTLASVSSSWRPTTGWAAWLLS